MRISYYRRKVKECVATQKTRKSATSQMREESPDESRKYPAEYRIIDVKKKTVGHGGERPRSVTHLSILSGKPSKQYEYAGPIDGRAKRGHRAAEIMPSPVRRACEIGLNEGSVKRFVNFATGPMRYLRRVFLG